MTFSKLIREYPISHGGRILLAPFPASGNISFVGSVAGGSSYSGSRALSEAHAAMLLEGTKSKSKDRIQILLDSLGASLSFAATNNRLVFTVLCRREDLLKVLGLVREALLEPTFPGKEFTTYKKREHTSLLLEAQQTRQQADNALVRALFKPGHPCYFQTTEETAASLHALSVRDVRAYHAQAIDASTLILSCAGDIDRDTAASIDKIFRKLPYGSIAHTAYESAPPPVASSVQIPIPDKASIDYVLGIAPGITSDSADYAALRLGIQILGNPGGFSGRLMKTVRERDGLTYGAYGFTVGFSRATDGYLKIWANFAPQLFEKGRASIRHELELLIEKGVTASEVKQHAAIFEAHNRTRSASSAALAGIAHSVAADGYRPSHLDEVASKTLALTHKQVNAALKKYLLIDRLAESAAGAL